VAITSDGHGGFTIDGPDDMKLFRVLVLRTGLALEVKGIRLSRRARSCYATVKEEFGIKGNKKRVLEQLDDLIEQCRAEPYGPTSWPETFSPTRR